MTKLEGHSVERTSASVKWTKSATPQLDRWRWIWIAASPQLESPAGNHSVSGMVPSSSLISRPTVFHDPDFVINYWQNNENKTFPAAGIHVKCSCAPGCRDFYHAVCNADAIQRWEFCPSVCPSDTRELWQNGRKICPDFYTIRKII